MNNKKFNPNEIGIPNGNYFGTHTSIEESDIVLIPIPWDVTTSLRDGTSNGPKAILDVSTNIDLHDFNYKKAWDLKVATHPFPLKIKEKNDAIRPVAKEIISKLSQGIVNSDTQIIENLKLVNRASDELNDWLFGVAKDYLSKNKIIGIVGGEHSVPFGLFNALAEVHEDFGVLHIDAHADLRQGYEGFSYSHASIMYNVSRLLAVSRFVQVGLRDVCEEEMDYAESDNRFHVYSNDVLATKKFKGINWNYICEEIVSKLPDKVYVSFDVDGLDPSLCPHTGTPVPGGLSYNEAIYLLLQLGQQGKTIIGFDICEVAPGQDDWDATVGAKILYQLSLLANKNR